MRKFDASTATIRSLMNEMVETLRPFVEAKVYNPNNSPSTETKRTLNVKAKDIERAQNLYEQLTRKEVVK